MAESDNKKDPSEVVKGVELYEVKATYVQEPDSCSIGNDPQELKVFTQDGGGGKFLVFSTERWAIDSVKDLEDVLKDFAKRAGIS